MRYPVVLLDVGETLIGPKTSFGGVYADVLAELGRPIPRETLDRALLDVWQTFDARIAPGIDRYRHFPGGEEEYWLRFAREALTRAADGTIDAAFAELALPELRDAFLRPSAWQVYDDVVPALDALAEAGHRLAVVSNWDSRLPRILDAVGLADRFELVVVSHLEGVEKPDPEIFRIALDRLGIAPSDALHVGDRPEMDLEGARRAGIDALVVDRKARLDDLPEAISDFAQLPRMARDGFVIADGRIRPRPPCPTDRARS